MTDRLDAKQILGFFCVALWLALLSPGVQIERAAQVAQPAAVHSR
jgi:hypothetical protein